MIENNNLENLNGIVTLSQNVNSFNLGSINEKNLNRKINIISGTKADIIFLSDIRLHKGGKKVEKSFLYANEPYLLHFNSSKSKRGVEILIRKKLELYG